MFGIKVVKVIAVKRGNMALSKKETENIMEQIEQKMIEYESTIHTMTTIILCFLAQSNDSFVIKKEIVEQIVNAEDRESFEFEFKVHDNGDGELILIRPDQVEGKKRVQEFKRTLPH